jgi:hypothetical protein
MPSQNLPKPNLPGQLHQDNSSLQSAMKPDENIQMPARTVFSQQAASTTPAAPAAIQPQQLQKPSQPQVVPGGLARENQEVRHLI